MSKPLFSLVSAVYGVAAYLPEFLESLDAQTLDHARFEVVLVLDGAVDASPELCQDWAARTDLTVTIVEQTNAGVASARNAGLARARGRWVSFPDPDDVLSATYLAEVARTIKAAGWRAPDAVLARTLISEGEAPHPHPLDWRFADGSGVVDFEGEHDLINLTTNCCAFRTSRVRRARLAFRSEVRPTFEDALFFAEYMLSAKRPRLALCAEAVYLYRKRTRGDSLVQRGSASAERYTTLLEQGYLRLLHLARERRGRIPRWCQDTVLYDLGGRSTPTPADESTPRSSPERQGRDSATCAGRSPNCSTCARSSGRARPRAKQPPRRSWLSPGTTSRPSPSCTAARSSPPTQASNGPPRGRPSTSRASPGPSRSLHLASGFRSPHASLAGSASPAHGRSRRDPGRSCRPPRG